MKTTVFKEFTFDSAHSLPHLPRTHKCSRLHGHTYHVRIEVTGEVGPLGIVVDYADIAKAWGPMHSTLDHTFLNDIPGLEISTSENLARWIYDRMLPVLPDLSAVIVRETCTAGAEVRGDGGEVGNDVR